MERKPDIQKVAEGLAGLGEAMKNKDQIIFNELMEKSDKKDLSLKEQIKLLDAQVALYERNAIELADQPEDQERLAKAVTQQNIAEEAKRIRDRLKAELEVHRQKTAENLNAPKLDNSNQEKKDFKEEEETKDKEKNFAEEETASGETLIGQLEKTKTFQEASALMDKTIAESDGDVPIEYKRLATLYREISENKITGMSMLNNVDKNTLHDIVTRFARYTNSNTFEIKTDRDVSRARTKIGKLYDKTIPQGDKEKIRQQLADQLDYLKRRKIAQEKSGEPLEFDDLSKEEVDALFKEKKKKKGTSKKNKNTSEQEGESISDQESELNPENVNDTTKENKPKESAKDGTEKLKKIKDLMETLPQSNERAQNTINAGKNEGIMIGNGNVIEGGVTINNGMSAQELMQALQLWNPFAAAQAEKDIMRTEAAEKAVESSNEETTESIVIDAGSSEAKSQENTGKSEAGASQEDGVLPEGMKEGDFMHVKPDEDGKYLEANAKVLHGSARETVIRNWESDDNLKKLQSITRLEKAKEAMKNLSPEGLEQVRMRKEAREAKEKFEEAYEKEMLEKNAGRRGMFRRGMYSMVGIGMGKSKELKALEEDYLNKEIARRESRYAKLMKNVENGTANIDKNRPDVNGRIRENLSKQLYAQVERQERVKENVRDSEKDKMRKEGKGYEKMEKTMEWFSKRSKLEKFAMTTAVLTPVAFASAGIVGALGLGAGIGGAAGASTIAWNRLTRSIMGATLGAAAVQGLENVKNENEDAFKEKNQKKFSQVDARKEFSKRKKEIEKSLRSEEWRNRRYGAAKLGVGVLVGGGAAAGLEYAVESGMELPSISEMKDIMSGDWMGDLLENNMSFIETPEMSESYAQSEMPGHEKSWVNAEPTGQESLSIPQDIGSYEVKSGDGVIKSIMGLRSELRGMYPNGNYPESIRDSAELIMSGDDPLEVATKIAMRSGMFDLTNQTGDSAIMEIGDKFVLKDNGSLVIERGETWLKNNGIPVEKGFSVTLLEDTNGAEKGGLNIIKGTWNMQDTIKTPEYSAEIGREEPPIGADARKLYRDGETGQWYAYAEYSNDPTAMVPGVQPGTLQFLGEGYSPIEKEPIRDFQQLAERYEPQSASQPIDQVTLEQIPGSEAVANAQEYVQRAQEAGIEAVEPVSEYAKYFSGTEEMRRNFFNEIASVRDEDVMKFIMEDPANRLAKIIPDGTFSDGFGDYQLLSESMAEQGVVMPKTDSPALAFMHKGNAYRIGMYESGKLPGSYTPMVQEMVRDANGNLSFRDIGTFAANDPQKMEKALAQVIALAN